MGDGDMVLASASAQQVVGTDLCRLETIVVKVVGQDL